MNKDKIFIVSFAVLGFVLSFITGLIFSVSFLHLFLRAFIFFIIFGGLGFIVILLLKKYIPELYNALTGINSLGSDSGNIDYTVDDDYTGEITGDDNELSGDRGNTGSGDSDDSEWNDTGELDDVKLPVKNSRAVNMGDHILINDKKIPNQPEVMADAIRTMIAKDSE